MITPELLRKEWPHAPSELIETFCEVAPAIFERFGLNTPLRIAHFMGQITAETGGASLRGMRESMNYRAPRIMQIFGVGHHSAAITESEAKKLAGNEYALSERVYGLGNPKKAKELGNTEKGDGFKYRGWGFLQTTGKGAWLRYCEIAGVGSNRAAVGPDEEFTAEMVELSLIMSVAEFCQPRILRAADRDDIPTVTRGVNGGFNGLQERKKDTAEWKSVITPEVATNGFKQGFAASGISVPKAVYPPGTLKIGDRGPKVLALQKLLKSKNYAVGTIDGDFGDLTRKAVGAFQLDHSLPATGYWTPADRDAADEEGTDQPISESRANATVADVRADASNPMKSVLDTADLGKKVAVATGGGGAVVKTIADSSDGTAPTDIIATAGDHLDKVKDVADQAQGVIGQIQSIWHMVQPYMPSPTVMVLIAIGAAAFLYFKRVEVKALLAHRNLDAF